MEKRLQGADRRVHQARGREGRAPQAAAGRRPAGDPESALAEEIERARDSAKQMRRLLGERDLAEAKSEAERAASQPGPRRRAPRRDGGGAPGAARRRRARARQAGRRGGRGARAGPGDRRRSREDRCRAPRTRMSPAGSRGGARRRPSGRPRSASAPTTSRARRRGGWARCRGWRRPRVGAQGRRRRACARRARSLRTRRIEGRGDRRARRRRSAGQAARLDAGARDGERPSSTAIRSASPAPTNRPRRAPGGRSCSTR